MRLSMAITLPTNELAPELADAADVLSDQLRTQLQRMSALLEHHVEKLDQRFQIKLEKLGYAPQQRAALAAITFGNAARILAGGQPALKFIEQVEYSGRRLAKLNLPPSAIVEALQQYDGLLTAKLKRLLRDASVDEALQANFQWVREQIHFCVILTLNNAYYQVREAETEAFYELFRVELESRNLDELLQRFLETLVGVCGADAGRIDLLNEAGDDWISVVTAPHIPAAAPVNQNLKRGSIREPRFFDCRTTPGTSLLDPAWKLQFESCWSIPLSKDGKMAGVMQFGFQRYYEWLPREQELLAAAAERCLMAAEKTRLMEHLAASEEQIRQLAEHMLHVEEMERRRISRELHDEAGQSLLCIRLQMELLEQALPESERESRQKLREARDLTERTILEMRRLIAALSPAVLEQLGLGAALRQLVARFQRVNPIHVKLSLTRLGGLPQKIEVIVYRLVQECFNNIGKHSQATTVNVSVTTADGVLRLDVEDNGVGFLVEEALARRDSFGLSGMRERVALLGGSFRLWSYPRSLERTGRNPDEAARVLRPRPAAKAASKKDRGTKISIELPITSQGNASVPLRPSGTLRKAEPASAQPRFDRVTAEWAGARRKLGTRTASSAGARPGMTTVKP
jgi:signal transduction histidine kinase